jgi:hypothetical protein
MAPYDDKRRSEIVQLAASAEGQCESLLVRIAQEHSMTSDDIAALWCLRTAFKQLRYHIRDNKPLMWWATDSHGDEGAREYTAYKNVLALVGAMVENKSSSRPWYRILLTPSHQGPLNEEAKRAKMAHVKSITSHNPPPGGGDGWRGVAERLTLPWLEADEGLASQPTARRK